MHLVKLLVFLGQPHALRLIAYPGCVLGLLKGELILADFYRLSGGCIWSATEVLEPDLANYEYNFFTKSHPTFSAALHSAESWIFSAQESKFLWFFQGPLWFFPRIHFEICDSNFLDIKMLACNNEWF